jgi:heme/copper-type cytochrome/quinol oxidase subunit 2
MSEPGRVIPKYRTGWGEPMRLEGWHVMVFLAMLLVVAAVVVAVTLIVLWTVRLVRKRKSGGPDLPSS